MGCMALRMECSRWMEVFAARVTGIRVLWALVRSRRMVVGRRWALMRLDWWLVVSAPQRKMSFGQRVSWWRRGRLASRERLKQAGRKLELYDGEVTLWVRVCLMSEFMAAGFCCSHG